MIEKAVETFLESPDVTSEELYGSDMEHGIQQAKKWSLNLKWSKENAKTGGYDKYK